MKSVQLILRDWKALLQHKHGRIALGFLVLVPLIYAGLFLAGYWNPYGRLTELPVAIVNMDQGSMLDNKPIHAGDDFVAELQKNKELDFHFVTSVEAEDGLKDGRYYMTIMVPENFSKEVGTLMDEHPKPAQLIYRTNAGTNYVASQVGSSAVKEMKAKIDASITKSYADGVFANMQELAKGISDAGNGAKSLNQGTSRAKDGFSQLTDGIRQISGGASRLQESSGQLTETEHQLQQGVQSTAEGTANMAEHMNRLADSLQSIEFGSSQISQGLKEWSDGSKQAAQGQAQAAQDAKSLNKALADYVSAHPDAANDDKLQSLVKASEGLTSNLERMSAALSKLSDSSQKLSDGQVQTSEGIQTFGSKLKLAADGVTQLSGGAAKLQMSFVKWGNGFELFAGGVQTLANGGQRLDTGTNELMNGLIQLTDGSGELSSKLNDAALKTSGIHTDDARSSMFAEPVQLVESKVTNVPNYGSGIAPYFLCLAFFVGGIMAANILPLGRRQEPNIAGSTHFTNKLGLFYTIGLIQTAIVDTIVLLGFKLQVTSIPLFILFTLLVSFTFLTIILMLINLFGLVGKFAAVTLLILQLATCGGTFPTELSSPVMKAIGQCLPMTYALHGLQHVITLGGHTQIGHYALIMLGYLFIAALIGLTATMIQHRKQGEAAAH
ncbi:YhgE/Pip domain-containing protein [Paenibacillus alginolyticus]|uniref:YhgE/Pip domain-containing protein n=1 Tax=Paenibacillus alginolyticus TaxID=59839 RepID=A0ABT4GKE4_9BACL|nr:YhgE/Pip domain-containing protein [Paenibacillus alginolyticus]MCY9696677.1 YhgE/Pip domain-containing protein [Paenibacillus alginolyticus]MEC0144945.1 YhgE/Pip domain-containing protein [Paenibacillus alginolyticus]